MSPDHKYNFDVNVYLLYALSAYSRYAGYMIPILCRVTALHGPLAGKLTLA